MFSEGFEGGEERKNIYKNYYSRLFEQSFVREICNEEFRGNFAKIEKKNILTNRGRKRSALMIVYIK